MRPELRLWERILGGDSRLDPAAVPTADPARQGGRRLSLLVGANLSAPGGPLRGHRVALELGAPLYQSLDGPQLESDWTMTAGWQLGF